MSMVEEGAKIVLILFVALWLLQVLTQNKGTSWLTSKFQQSGKTTTPSTAPGSISGFAPGAGAGSGGGGGGGGSF